MCESLGCGFCPARYVVSGAGCVILVARFVLFSLFRKKIFQFYSCAQLFRCSIAALPPFCPYTTSRFAARYSGVGWLVLVVDGVVVDGVVVDGVVVDGVVVAGGDERVWGLVYYDDI